LARSPDPTLVFPKARRAYEDGASVRALRRRFHMTESEARDAFPEEFEAEAIDNERKNGY